MNQLYLFLGSLGAVLGLAAIAWALRLGGGGIDSEAEAMAAAEDALSGFDAASAIVGDDRRAAIVRGQDGSAALLKMHGARIAVRRVPWPVVGFHEDGDFRIDSGDPRFGEIVVRGAGGRKDP